MKVLTLILLFLGTGTLFAQNTPIITNRSLKSSDANILFRGFENIVELKKKPGDTNAYVLVSSDCAILTTRRDGRQLTPGTFILKVRNAKSVQVNVYRKSDMKNSVMTLNYTVSNVPAGKVYLDDVANGGELTTISGKIAAKQPDDSPLTGSEMVSGWTISFNEEMFQGSGNMLSQEALDAMKELTSGTVVLMTCNSVGEDEITRKRSAQFTIR